MKLLLAFVLAAFVTACMPSDSSPDRQPTLPSQEMAPFDQRGSSEANMPAMQQVGYLQYDVAELAADKNVLFFAALDWCTTCQALDENLRENIEAIPADTQILVVDYDNDLQLRERYDVDIQHTLIQVDSEGNELKRWIGSLTLEQILSQVS